MKVIHLRARAATVSCYRPGMAAKAPRTIAAIGLVAAGVIAGPACSYDWAGGGVSATSDGGPPKTDATAPITDASAADASYDAAIHEDGATGDAAGPSCADILSDIGAAKLAAQEDCSVSCTSTIADQCGCTYFVADPSSTATSDLGSAVAAFKSAHCTASCGTCATPPTSVQCLAGTGSDGGIAAVCHQP
jgi:hypothetical protein